MKRKILEFNLAELNEQQLIQMLDDNHADMSELLSLLSGLFEMWASALKFSSAVARYGEERHDNFLRAFIEHQAPQHGISAEKLTNVLNFMKAQKRATSTRVH